MGASRWLTFHQTQKSGGIHLQVAWPVLGPCLVPPWLQHLFWGRCSINHLEPSMGSLAWPLPQVFGLWLRNEKLLSSVREITWNMGAADLRLRDLPRFSVASIHLLQLWWKPRLIANQKPGHSRAHPQLLGMQHSTRGWWFNFFFSVRRCYWHTVRRYVLTHPVYGEESQGLEGNHNY